jgi:hypothetical protein
MTLRYNATLRTAQATAIATEAGSGAQIKIYTGTQPASVATAPTGTLLGTLVISGTFGTATGGVLTFNTVTSDTSADTGGTAGWFRIMKSDGTTGVLDGNITTTGGGGDMTLNTTTITAGGTIAISSGTITVGNP